DIQDRARKSLANFRHLVEDWQKRAPHEPAIKLATDILRKSGLFDALKADTSPEGIGRLENVNAVLDAISEFSDAAPQQVGDLALPPEGGAGGGLPAYLQTVTLLTDADEPADSSDYITLMSVHAAKGLEFRSIFVTGMEENLFPSFMAMEDPKGLDEERRLFYVAITRAKELLTISFAQNRYRFGQIRVSEPSRFLEEIGTEHFEFMGGLGTARLHASGQRTEPARASVSGNFTQSRLRPMPARPAAPAALPPDFKAAAPEEIQPGMRVLHLKFGEGQIMGVEGPKDNKVATIQFKGDEVPERRIVLKFAKLQVL
ncbi:MAG TPA: 3'-5' exonuclease, partial [Saprospiraceae bacterium]|nr:3'-5' exonuclease [Saprospiraceae bacterium]